MKCALSEDKEKQNRMISERPSMLLSERNAHKRQECMKKIDKAVVICAVYFGFFMLYTKFSRNVRLTPFLAFASSLSLYQISQRLLSAPMQKWKEKKRQRARAEQFVQGLFLHADPAGEIAKLLAAENGEPICYEDGILCRYDQRRIWAGLCLRHSASGTVTDQEIAKVLIGLKKHRADECMLIALCPKGKSSADPLLSSVRVIDKDGLAALYQKHPELLENAELPRREKRGTLLRAFRRLRQPPAKNKIRAHFGYALLLLPSCLLTRNPILLVCAAFQTIYAIYGVIAMFRSGQRKEGLFS